MSNVERPCTPPRKRVTIAEVAARRRATMSRTASRFLAAALVVIACAPPAGAAGEKWWSLRPVVRPPLPPVKDRGWVRTPIDAFILAGLEAKGLCPAPPADRVTLIRRLTFDLHGLPPT